MALRARARAPVALVTGGGRGIGRATARAFAAAGWAVVIAERVPALGRGAARAIERSGGRARFIGTDVADWRSVRRAIADVERRFGRLDCLVNNAGVLTGGPLVGLPVRILERTLAVNLLGPLLCTRAALPLMLRRGRGAVISVASQLGKVGVADYATYCASKFGVVGFTESLAEELRGTGVRVWAVCPGLVDTPMARQAGVTAGARAALLRPETVASVIVGLATGRRKAPTGTAVDVTR